MRNGWSEVLRVRARGALACFSRPELKVERVSYPVMTPSAARGILEAILWKPAMQWRVEKIAVLSPIRFTAFRRNEVGTRAVAPTKAVMERGGAAPVFFADEDRQQRNTVALRDVDYVIEARFRLTDRAGPEDNMSKFVSMFRRRVEKGQHFHQPYFGCREFVAQIEPADRAPEPIDDSRDLGIMLWDIHFARKRNRPLFFAARLANGVLAVPPDPEASFAATASVKGAVQ